jgi:hypothetical protein
MCHNISLLDPNANITKKQEESQKCLPDKDCNSSNNNNNNFKKVPITNSMEDTILIMDEMISNIADKSLSYSSFEESLKANESSYLELKAQLENK